MPPNEYRSSALNVLRRSGNSQAVEKVIVESKSNYLSQSKELEKERKKINDFVEKEKAEKKIEEDEYIYVRSLMKRFNPKMFD